MADFSRFDFREATKLVRAGKLAEATSLLKASIKPVIAASVEPVIAASDAEPPPRIVEQVLPVMETTPGRLLAERVQPFFGGRAFESFLRSGFGDVHSRSAPIPSGARFEERVFADEAGTRTYKIFIPSGYVGQALPVVIMLHGCTQSPDDFAAGTRMNELAEQKTFLVAYPAQPQSANMQKCWNWFKADDQLRDEGEPSLIAGITRQVIQEFSADATRVYVAGLSAGGAEAAIMAATYPDLFAAVGIHSGLAYGAALDMPSAFTAMNGGSAGAVRRMDRLVPTIVFHGDGDSTVHPINGDQIIAQAARGGDLREIVTTGETPEGMRFTRTVHADKSGREILEQWVLHGAGHAWSGGSADGSFTEPRGPDATREMVRFFLGHANAGDKVGGRKGSTFFAANA